MNSPALDLSQAFRIAVEVHGSQRDKAGEPYLFHVMRVAMAMETDEERVVAILHDVLEDAGSASDEYRHRIDVEYGTELCDVVDALTREGGEPYEDYIQRLGAASLAVKVKLADLEDNMSPRRLRKLDAIVQSQLYNRYSAAMDYLIARSPGGRALFSTAASSPHPAPDAQS